jgi:uncharacterized protein DUF4430
MRILAVIATLTVATFVCVFGAAFAEAAPKQVNVRIEGKSETLFEGPIWTEGHYVQASSDSEARRCDATNNKAHRTPGPTPTAASVDAMSLIGETFDGQWYGSSFDDYFITRWGPDEQSPAQAAYWGILVNNVFTNVGGCQYELNEGNEVLWVYDAFKSRAFLALLPVADHYSSGPRPLTATTELGKPFEVEVVDYADQQEDQPPSEPERTGSSADEGAEVSPVQSSAKGFEKVETESAETVTTNAQGKAILEFTEPGWHRIKATAFNAEGEEAVRSNRLDVCVLAQGASTCLNPFPEDQVRTPPHTEEEAKREEEARGHEEAELHEQEEAKRSEEEAKRSGEETKRSEEEAKRSGEVKASSNQEGKSEVLPAIPGAVSPLISPQSDVPVVPLTVQSITVKRLLLKFSVTGTAIVTLRRQIGAKYRLRWQFVKTIVVNVYKPGETDVKLPRLATGRYLVKVKVDLAGTHSVTRTLTVSRGA